MRTCMRADDPGAWGISEPRVSGLCMRVPCMHACIRRVHRVAALICLSEPALCFRHAFMNPPPSLSVAAETRDRS